MSTIEKTPRGTTTTTQARQSGSRQNPSDFLKQITGRFVVVKLNNGSDYRGVLKCLDGYMNIVLEQTEEYINGEFKRKYGDAFIRGTEDPLDLLEFCLDDIQMNAYQLSKTKLIDLEKLIKSKVGLTNKNNQHYRRFSGALNAINDLVELSKLSEYDDRDLCDVKALSLIGKYSSSLLKSQEMGNRERKVDGMVGKMLEKQAEDGPCDHSRIREVLILKRRQVCAKPTTLDDLRQCDTKDWFRKDSLDPRIATQQWPNIFINLAGKELFPSAFMSKKLRFPPKKLINFVETKASLKKLVKLYDTKLKPMCLDYMQNGMGLFVPLASFIKLFIPGYYDDKYDMPSLFHGELPEDEDVTMSRTQWALYGLSEEKFHAAKRAYFLCSDLVVLERHQLDKIFESIPQLVKLEKKRLREYGYE